jgi:hypothetical protein
MMEGVSIEQARDVKREAVELFSRLATVAGVGITKLQGGYGIKVNLREEPTPGTLLPETIRGVPVKVEVVGRIRKL